MSFMTLVLFMMLFPQFQSLFRKCFKKVNGQKGVSKPWGSQRLVPGDLTRPLTSFQQHRGTTSLSFWWHNFNRKAFEFPNSISKFPWRCSTLFMAINVTLILVKIFFWLTCESVLPRKQLHMHFKQLLFAQCKDSGCY